MGFLFTLNEGFSHFWNPFLHWSFNIVYFSLDPYLCCSQLIKRITLSGIRSHYPSLFLFFNAQNYSCCSKISKRFTRESQMGTRESQNGHSGLLKWLVSLVISKLALLPILRLPLAHLRLPHEPFLKFSSQQEKIFSSKKGKKNRTNYYWS